MKKHFALLLVTTLSARTFMPLCAQTNSDNVLNFGPKNKLNEKFATLYVMRPDDTLDKKKWYSIKYEETSLGQFLNNSKYEIRFPLYGKKRFWAQHDPSSPTSGVWVELEYGKSYYLKLQITPGQDHPNPVLLLLDSITGKSDYANIKNAVNSMFYPVPANLPESMLVGNPFNRNILEPYYYDKTDSLYYWKYRFKVPSFFHYVFISEKHIYQFPYSNTLLSPTYSEFLRIQGFLAKKIETEDDLLSYVKKSLGNGKGMKNKKEKLVSLNYEPVKAFGDFGWLALSEVEDHGAANKQKNEFLLLREIRACIYKKTKEEEKVLMVFWLSARGAPDELYTLDEMKQRLIKFLSGWKYIDISKSELKSEGSD
jgi:hypothetical protein